MALEIAQLFAKLSADSSALTSGLAQARRDITGTAGIATTAATAVGTAFGQLAVHGLIAAGNATLNMGRQALDAVASYERLGMSLESMVAKELARGQVSMQATTKAIQLTAEEAAEVASLGERLQDAGLKIAVMKEKYDAAASSGKKSAAEMAVMADNIADLEAQMAGWAATIDGLNGKNGQLVTVMQEVVTGQMSMKEALEQAGPKAQELLNWIQQLAIVSPFSQDTISSAFKTALAYSFTMEEAKRLTEAVVDFAAGTGAAPDMMNRIGLALGQIHAKGKLAGQEILQLTEAGIGVADILKGMGFTLEDVSKGVVKADDFIEALTSTLENDFGGAAERQAGTFTGLLSSLQDLKTVGLREFFTGTFEAIKPHLQGFVDMFSDPAFMANVRAWGEVIGTHVAGALDFAGGVFGVVRQRAEGFFALLRNGQSPLEAARILLLSLIPPDLRDDFDSVAKPLITFAESIVEAFQGKVLPAIQSVWSWIVEHSEEVKGALVGVGAVLAGAGIIAAIVSVAAAIAALTNPITLIIAAAALLGAAWAGNWGGIRDTLTAFWNNTALPILTQLWQWLQTNIPIALQVLSGFWTGTLQPAIAAVGDWIQTTLLPTLSGLWAWLQTTIPAALKTLSDFWTLTLLPAVQAVWGWMSEVLFPFFKALDEFVSATFNKTLEAQAGTWQNVILPALTKVWDYLDKNVMPIFKAVGDYLSTQLQPIFEGLEAFITQTFLLMLANLKTSFDKITGAIKDATTWLGDMATKIGELKLPWWMTPGSPTPFEMGLRGISAALKEMSNAALPPFNAGLGNMVLAGATAGMAGTGRSQTGSAGGPTIYHNETININNEAALALYRHQRRREQQKRDEELM